MMAADWLTDLPLPPFAIISLIFLIYIIGGSFIDDLAFMILAIPTFSSPWPPSRATTRSGLAS